MTNRKGQMKIQQMAFMLIAVTLFFALAGLFVVTVLFSGLREQGESLQEQEALLLASRLANSPEFSCGNAFGTSRVNCIDLDKAMALKTNKDYSRFWGVEGIEVQKIHGQESRVECTEENYPNCGKITLVNISKGQGVGVSNFVALCRKQAENVTGLPYDLCTMGRVVITYESQ